jgi:hypothetical protein
MDLIKPKKEGGMFGINDNNTQTSNVNDQKPVDAPSETPLNPFGDSPDMVSSPSSAPTLQPSAPVPAPTPAPSPPATFTPAPSSPSGGDPLLDLKEQALKNLQPLVSHLDQTPEEKFKTTMMLIQASDDSSLVGQAYEAANSIPDEKARAQALLDVVNEINYFTHKNNGDTEAKS